MASSNPVKANSDSDQDSHLRVLRILLRPLVKFCLRRAVRIQDIYRVLRKELLRSAREMIEEEGLEISVSRLSVMTGIPRKLVAQIEDDPLDSRDRFDIMTRVISQWQLDPQFQDSAGRPKALIAEGEKSEFTQLIESVSAEFSPYTVLFELERTGMVIRKGRSVELRSSFHLGQNLEEVISIVGDDIDALIKAGEANSSGVEKEPFLHLSTFFDNVSDQDIATAKSWALQEGSSLQNRAHDFLGSLDRDVGSPDPENEGKNRLRLCTFFFSEPVKKRER